MDNILQHSPNLVHQHLCFMCLKVIIYNCFYFGIFQKALLTYFPNPINLNLYLIK